MKLEVEIDIPVDAVDKAELQQRVRTETILSLLADHKVGLEQAASELQISPSTVVDLLRERGKSTSHAQDDLASGRTWTKRSERDLELLDRVKREAATMTHVPTIEQVRAALASIPGSMSEVVIAERGEY